MAKENIQDRRRSTNDLSAQGFGKLPPQARELEEAVLGAVMLEENAISEIKFLQPEMFYVEAHQKIYQAIFELSIAESPIDILTVPEQLKKNGYLEQVGGRFYVAQLTNKIGTAGNIEYHAKIIQQKWLLRQAICLSTNTTKDSYEETSDPIEVIDEAIANFSALSDGIKTHTRRDIRSAVTEISTEMTVRRNTPDDELPSLGIATGIEPLDNYFIGFMPGNLIIIGGNPSEGKSTTALQSIRHTVKVEKVPADFFSLEMTIKELVQKLCSMESGVSLEKIIDCKMETDEWLLVNRAFDEIASWPLYLYDIGGIDILELMSLAKADARKHKIKAVFVDYLQLVTVSAATCKAQHINNKEGKVSFISEKLKELAKKLDLPVIALAQLSRENEKRSGDNKRPQNSDLRDSGAIEQNADIIIFVFRPEKHGIVSYANGEGTNGITEFIISKYRMGPLKTVRAKFKGANSLFVNIDEYQIDSKSKKGGSIFTQIGDSDVPF